MATKSGPGRSLKPTKPAAEKLAMVKSVGKAAAAPEPDKPLPIDSIFVQHNDRTDFSADAIETLARSIQERGLDNAITVRLAAAGSPAKYELIAGERRLRACRSLQMSVIRARIIPADDRTADLLRLEENLLREDLNQIDRAAGLKRYIERHKESQGQVGKRFGMTQSQVSNLLRLLQLPEFWRDEIAAGRVSHTVIRDTLLPWIKRPQLLEHVKQSYLASEAPYTPQCFENWLHRAGMDLTRPVTFGGYYPFMNYSASTCCFKFDAKKDAELDVYEFNGQPRAFNVEAWEKRNQPERQKLLERQNKEKEALKAGHGITTKPAKGKHKKNEPAACDVYKLKAALASLWLTEIRDRLHPKKHRQQIPRLAFTLLICGDTAPEFSDGLMAPTQWPKFADVMDAVFQKSDADLASWLFNIAKETLPELSWCFNSKPESLLAMAAMLGMPLLDTFKPDAAVLDSYSTDSLVAFCHDHELNHDQPRENLISELLANWPPGFVPQEVREIEKTN